MKRCLDGIEGDTTKEGWSVCVRSVSRKKNCFNPSKRNVRLTL